MVLSDRDLKKAIKAKHIKIDPVPDFNTQLGSCSVDLRLGNTFRIFEQSKFSQIDPFKDDIGSFTHEIKIEKNKSFIIHPGDFILGSTMEYIEIPDDLVAALEGRSSIGRLGIIIHSTAAQIDAGFRGNITLEIANMGKMPVALYPGMRVCSISFQKLTSPADVPYYKKKNAKYLYQKGPDESKINKER